MSEAGREALGVRRDGRLRPQGRSALHLELRAADHRLQQFLRREPDRADAVDPGGQDEAGDRQDRAAGRRRRGLAPDPGPACHRQSGRDALDLREDAMSEDITVEKVQALLIRAPYHQWLGLQVLAVHDDGIDLKAAWREEWVVNPDRRYTHGGVLAALVDLAADLALVKRTGRGVPTLDLRVDYHTAALPGDLTAKGKVIRLGGQFSCAEAQVFDAEGKLLASGRGTYFTAPPPPPKG